jgi:double-strand break repair protein MRE11
MNEPDLKSLDAALLEATETGDNSGLEKVTVTSLVHEYLEAQNLNVLSESLIQNAVDEFVGKGDKDAVGK